MAIKLAALRALAKKEFAICTNDELQHLLEHGPYRFMTPEDVVALAIVRRQEDAKEIVKMLVEELDVLQNKA